jgi:hypothetical protein
MDARDDGTDGTEGTEGRLAAGVGHSYGGTVITNAATGRANVKAPVYVAAFAPDAGESAAALLTK